MWVSKSVPFDKHLYVLEISPITGMKFCEHEDEGHVLKVYSVDCYYGCIADCFMVI